MLSRPLRFIRDGALLGVLAYSIMYAAYLLRGTIATPVSYQKVGQVWDWAHGVVASLGMMGIGYFLLGGVVVGMIPLLWSPRAEVEVRE